MRVVLSLRKKRESALRLPPAETALDPASITNGVGAPDALSCGRLLFHSVGLIAVPHPARGVGGGGARRPHGAHSRALET